MKTAADVEAMKAQSNTPFGTTYNFLIASLENFYVSKSNGVELIKKELSDWDKEARSQIIDALIREIKGSGANVDPEELMKLI